MTPRVTVVMGVYNDADGLPETIDSVLAQTLGDFEFIVVDDGSTNPRVAQVLSAYEQKDARMKVLRKQNQGLTVALVDGCRAATGEFIARIDVGDTMEPTRLETQCRWLAADPACGFVSCHTGFHGPRWEALWIAKGRCDGNAPVSILPSNPDDGLAGDVSHHGSVMFRRSAYEAVGGYRREFYYGQDWDLWYRLAECGTYFVVPEVLYRARVFPGGISMRNAERQRNIAECSRGAFRARRLGLDERPWLERAAAIRPKPAAPQAGKAKKPSEAPGLYFVGEALRRNRNAQCRRYLVAVIKADPLEWRAYVRLLQSVAL